MKGFFPYPVFIYTRALTNIIGHEISDCQTIWNSCCLKSPSDPVWLSKNLISRAFNGHLTILSFVFILPTSTATRSPVSLCSFTSWIMGFSPGAVALLITVRALTWVTERTVAAVSQGRPKRGQMAPRITMSRRSRWKPEPLISRRSFLLTINLRRAKNRINTHKESVYITLNQVFYRWS